MKGCVVVRTAKIADREKGAEKRKQIELNFFFEEKRFSSPTQGLLSGTPALAAPSAGFTL